MSKYEAIIRIPLAGYATTGEGNLTLLECTSADLVHIEEV